MQDQSCEHMQKGAEYIRLNTNGAIESLSLQDIAWIATSNEMMYSKGPETTFRKVQSKSTSWLIDIGTDHTESLGCLYTSPCVASFFPVICLPAGR
eukprot:4721791-Amphidinium_carterae.1